MKIYEIRDEFVFGKSMIENCILNSWQKRIWGAWKVLCGDAGIILVRHDPMKTQSERQFKESV
jgi:hypothetical protein